MAIGCTQSAYGWWPRNSDEVTIGYNKIYQMANSQFARAYSLTTEYKQTPCLAWVLTSRALQGGNLLWLQNDNGSQITINFLSSYLD